MSDPAKPSAPEAGDPATLSRLEAGTPLLIDDDRIVRVSAELAAQFTAGDRLAVVPSTGEILRIPAAEQRIAERAVTAAQDAFRAMASVDDAQISLFYDDFAAALESQAVWSEIAGSNAEDVAAARARGRSTTRLEVSDAMREGMIEGLRGWIAAPSRRGRIVETVRREGFRVELVGAALGVIAFVFEGRPNVLADACGVLRGGNTVVFRIGSDALRTARAMMQLALEPALAAAGLPRGAVSLVASASHAAGWALFSDARLSLAVARGSGPAVAALGALARRAGIAVSLHGTGGAWLVAGVSARETDFARAVVDSLDRKVCNTLNTCCLPRAEARRLVPVLLESLERAAHRRSGAYKLHVARGSEDAVPPRLFDETVLVQRAAGAVRERQAEPLEPSELGREWEWEDSPEITLQLVDDVAEAIRLFNRYSPRFVASLVSRDSEEHARFYEGVDAPFVGDGYTRWVDGQLALGRPELGLSNWQHGRLLARGGILSGDSIYTLRARYVRE